MIITSKLFIGYFSFQFYSRFYAIPVSVKNVHVTVMFAFFSIRTWSWIQTTDFSQHALSWYFSGVVNSCIYTQMGRCLLKSSFSIKFCHVKWLHLSVFKGTGPVVSPTYWFEIEESALSRGRILLHCYRKGHLESFCSFIYNLAHVPLAVGVL